MTDKTAPEKEIAAQVATAGPKDARATGILKAEQPVREEIPDTAVVVREYAKWTDNNGNFHKVPLDGTTAIREPAHEQHELTVEDRDRLDQAMALKTPRRKVEGAPKINAEEVHNNDVHAVLEGKGVEAAPVEEGKIEDGKGFENSTMTPEPGENTAETDARK